MQRTGSGACHDLTKDCTVRGAEATASQPSGQAAKGANGWTAAVVPTRPHRESNAPGLPGGALSRFCKSSWSQLERLRD